MPEKNEHYYELTLRIYPENDHFRLTDTAWQDYLREIVQDSIGKAGKVVITKVCKQKLPK